MIKMYIILSNTREFAHYTRTIIMTTMIIITLSLFYHLLYSTIFIFSFHSTSPTPRRVRYFHTDRVQTPFYLRMCPRAEQIFHLLLYNIMARSERCLRR
jgi:hypothetical protein